MSFLVFGSMNIDNVYRVPHIAVPGETISSSEYQKNVGGKGLNQAIALARAGQKTLMAGAVGEDGAFLTDYLEQSGVDIRLINHLKGPSGHAIIQVDEKGQNSIFLFGGANQSVDQKYITDILERFGEEDWLLVQNEISNMKYLLDSAAEKKMHIIVNPSPFNAEILAWPLDRTEWLILNEVEAAGLTDKAHPVQMAEELIRRFPQLKIVLTLGENGSVYIDRSMTIHQEAEKVRAVDTTGAGDTFTGFFFQGVVSGLSIRESLKRASRASAVAVSRPGAAASIPCFDEL